MPIIKSNEALLIDNVHILIYGEAGVGKTSIAATSNNPIILDFDEGAYRSGYRKDIYKFNSYEEIKSDIKGFVSVISTYDTIIIDTIGSLQDMIKNYLLIKDPSLSNKRKSFELWGNLLTETMDLFKLIKSLKKTTISIAHVQEKTKGEDLIKRPVIAGQSKDQLYRFMDFIGYMYFKNGNRELLFGAKDDGIEAKNTGNVEDLIIPFNMDDNFFELVIERFIKSINEQNANNQLAIKEIREITEMLNKFNTPEEFTKFTASLKNVVNKNIIWELILDKAKKVGYTYDKKSKVFG